MICREKRQRIHSLSTKRDQRCIAVGDQYLSDTRNTFLRLDGFCWRVGPGINNSMTELPYRPCVGVVLINAQGNIFTGERVDTPGAWQMPQGGIDPGEDPQSAALRELEEETSVPASSATLIAEHPDWVTYDLPDHLLGKLWKGRFRGQKQKWFLFRFDGNDDQIDLTKHSQEFARWRWSTPAEVVEHIVPFKRSVYEQVIQGFAAELP